MSVCNAAPILVFVLGVLACARDQDAPPGQATDITGVDTSAGTNSSTLATTDPTSGGSGDPDTTAGSSETGTTGDDECLGAEGCYACDPEDSVQLLNHCTDADCQPFANTPERLPLLEADGSLPPIP